MNFLKENKEMQRKLFAIAIPIMLSNLISQVQMLIDRVFIGRLDITAMSAVSNASSPMWTTMDVVFTLAVGSAILISQSIGAGDKERAKRLMSSLFKYANCLAGIIFVVWFFCSRQIFGMMGVADSVIDMSVDYAKYFAPSFLLIGLGSAISTMLQVSAKTGIMVWYGIVRSVANIILDYGLVFGNFGLPRMEVAGAALATTIAEVLGDAVILVYVILSKDIWLRPSIKEIFAAKFVPYVESVRKGLPAAFESFAWNMGNLYLIVMLNRISASAAGIYSITFGVELLPVCIIGSMSNAVLTLSGIEAGRKNNKGVATVAILGVFWSMVLAVFMLVTFTAFPQTIIGWFTTDRDVISSSALYLVIVGIDLFPKSTNIMVGSAIKGYGDTKWMLFTQLIGTAFVIGMSSILVLLLNQGIAMLFGLVVADETLRCVINTWKLKKISKKPIAG